MEFKRRPWGWYLTLINKEHFKVKLLKFKRGGECSLQRHKHRNELWCFIKGWGAMRFGMNQRDLHTEYMKSGETILIIRNEWHKFEARSPALVLEIQYGEKCSEEDIERA